jgi:hypothetical protein
MKPGRLRSSSTAEITAGEAWIAGAALVLAAVVVYSRSLDVPFVFDDAPAVVNNPTLRNLWSIDIFSPPANGSGVTGRPLVNVTLAINYAIGGSRPFGYHVVNLLLHAAAGLALFGLLRRTLKRPAVPARLRNAATGLSFMVALLWTLNPLQTESVICVVQRTEVLVGVFYLLTLYAFVRAADSGASNRWRLVCVGACCLGMASK